MRQGVGSDPGIHPRADAVDRKTLLFTGVWKPSTGMGIRFKALDDRLGGQPSEWPERLAAARACKRRSLSSDDVTRLFEYVRDERAARGGSPVDASTFDVLEAEFEEAARSHFGEA